MQYCEWPLVPNIFFGYLDCQGNVESAFRIGVANYRGPYACKDSKHVSSTRSRNPFRALQGILVLAANLALALSEETLNNVFFRPLLGRP